ncbi:MAG: hypothetical protein K0S58_3344 [Nitrospira sp.]|nr:hypothetical protein [Nitrospira sp.]
MEKSTRPTIVSLASSLLVDLRRLVAQELQLAKHEMQHEVSKFCLTLVYVLHSLLGLSLWVSYGVVALLAAAGAGGLVYLVIKLGSSLRLWPFRTLHTLKEDAQWIKTQVLWPKT